MPSLAAIESSGVIISSLFTTLEISLNVRDVTAFFSARYSSINLKLSFCELSTKFAISSDVRFGFALILKVALP